MRVITGSLFLAAALGCGPPRLPSVQLFIENRTHTAVAVPAGEPLTRRGGQELTAGVRVGFELEQRREWRCEGAGGC